MVHPRSAPTAITRASRPAAASAHRPPAEWPEVPAFDVSIRPKKIDAAFASWAKIQSICALMSSAFFEWLQPKKPQG